jgi:hypothetical protein
VVATEGKSGFVWEKEQRSLPTFERAALTINIAFQTNMSRERNLTLKKEITANFGYNESQWES